MPVTSARFTRKILLVGRERVRFDACPAGIELLQQAGNHAQGYIERWLDLNTLDYLLARHEYLERADRRSRDRRNRRDLPGNPLGMTL